MPVTIRPLLEADLPMVRQWRNDPAVRPFMLTQHEISADEHRAWFLRVENDDSRQLLLVEEGGTPIGYVQFSNVEEGGVADWGFYARPGAPKGSGQKLGKAALSHAFTALRLHKVCGEVIDSNHRSIALHKRLGFKEEGVQREQCRINGVYHALVNFGLLAREWHD